MTNFPKTIWQDVKQEAPNKFLRVQRHRFYLIPACIVAPKEHNLSILQRQDPLVGDCHAIRIAAKIRKHLIRASKRRLAVNHLLLRIATIEQFLVHVRKLLPQKRQKLSTKFRGKDPHRQEEFPFGFPPLSVFC